MEFSNSEIKTLASSHFDLRITNNQPLPIFSLSHRKLASVFSFALLDPVGVGTQEILLKVIYSKSLVVAPSSELP